MIHTPDLISIDLSKCIHHPGSASRVSLIVHPDIKIEDEYLVQIDGDLFCGQFIMQWYGLTFDGWFGTKLQFDAPGTNGSKWQAIWRIVR